jgi:hypothetical protein
MSDLLLKAGGTNWLYFDGSGDNVNCGSAPQIDDLPPDTDLTIEAWVRVATDETTGAILCKTDNSAQGWFLIVQAAYARAVIKLDGADVSLRKITNLINDGQPHHLAITWDQSELAGKLYQDGVLLDDDIGLGNYIPDAAYTMRFGTYSSPPATPFKGYIGGWARISHTIRYTDTFTPNPPSDPPAVDGSTTAQWNFTEGTGATLADEKGFANGTITGAKWAVL